MSAKNQRLLGQLATALVCLVMLIAFFISGIRLFGFQVYGVLSGSMEPTYPTGSLIYVRRVDPSELKLRDVITFQVSRSTIATHRIIEIVTDPGNPASLSFRTQGDANDSPDANLVSPGSIIGRVSFCIPYMGTLASYIQSPRGTVVTIIFCLALVAFVFYTDMLERDSRHRGKKGRRTARSGGASQRNGRQASQAARASRSGKTQAASAGRRQQGYSQEYPVTASHPGNGVRQAYRGYPGAPDERPQRTGCQQPDRRGYVQQAYEQQGYARQYPREGYQGYGDQRGGQPGYSAQGYPAQYGAQRQYPAQSGMQQGYARQEYARTGGGPSAYPQQPYPRQEYSRQAEARRGYPQGAQRPTNRPNQANAESRANPHSWSYGYDRDDGQ